MGRAARNQPGTCKRAHLIVDKGTQRALGAAPLQEEHTVGLCLGVPKRRDLVLRAQGGPTHRQSQPSVRTPPYPTLPCPCAHRVVAEGAGAALGARAAQVVGAVGQLPRVKAADLHLAALLLLLLLSSGGCRLGSRRLEGGGACVRDKHGRMALFRVVCRGVRGPGGHTNLCFAKLGAAVRGILAGLDVAHEHEHVVAGAGQGGGDLEADAAVGARDNGERPHGWLW